MHCNDIVYGKTYESAQSLGVESDLDNRVVIPCAAIDCDGFFHCKGWSRSKSIGFTKLM